MVEVNNKGVVTVGQVLPLLESNLDGYNKLSFAKVSEEGSRSYLHSTPSLSTPVIDISVSSDWDGHIEITVLVREGDL